MKNPWEEIPLTDYENHMKLDSVMQLQTMNVLKAIAACNPQYHNAGDGISVKLAFHHFIHSL